MTVMHKMKKKKKLLWSDVINVTNSWHLNILLGIIDFKRICFRLRERFEANTNRRRRISSIHRTENSLSPHLNNLNFCSVFMLGILLLWESKIAWITWFKGPYLTGRIMFNTAIHITCFPENEAFVRSEVQCVEPDTRDVVMSVRREVSTVVTVPVIVPCVMSPRSDRWLPTFRGGIRPVTQPHDWRESSWRLYSWRLL
jgi:hypothetical protein